MSSEKMALNIWPETGQLLGVSRKTAYELANSQNFPILVIGKRKLVPIKALEKWIEQNTVTECNSK